ncbi:hypothetical protein [Corallococcus exercitus]
MFVLNNLPAHEAPLVAVLCATYDVKVLYLPPSSSGFNPIEPG